jgi:hypothetical protein
VSLSSLEDVTILPEIRALMGERVVVNNDILASVFARCESKDNNEISEGYSRVQPHHIAECAHLQVRDWEEDIKG